MEHCTVPQLDWYLIMRDPTDCMIWSFTEMRIPAKRPTATIKLEEQPLSHMEKPASQPLTLPFLPSFIACTCPGRPLAYICILIMGHVAIESCKPHCQPLMLITVEGIGLQGEPPSKSLTKSKSLCG